MVSKVIELIRAHRAQFLDRSVTRIIEVVPRYGVSGGVELRENVAIFFEDVMSLAEAGERPGFSDRQIEVTKKRVEQGFEASDYLMAILATIPVLRQFVREIGPQNDPEFAKAFTQLESFLQGAAAAAGNAYVEIVSRRLESKNQELNALNQRLAAHEKLATSEAKEASSALAAMNEFNRRVLESLTSGLLVVQTGTQIVTLYSSRMEEILGIPTEQVVGKPITEALAGIAGLPLAEHIRLVRSLGRLPVTKLRLKLPNGRSRAVLTRAHRMYDAAGKPEGTVVMVDDVTERELLVDSFSRYVSRDLVQRLIARGETMSLGGEQRTCTILFADIRGFTSIAETSTPEELHELLNEYFRVVIGAIVDRGGFIDKFVGDKAMALFTAGRDSAEGAAAALDAASDIVQRLRKLNRERAAAGRQVIDVGIGINTGDVMLGNIGSEERMDFTAIGDAVNIADRLQAIAKAGEIVAGDGTVKLAPKRFTFRGLGQTALKGRTATVAISQLEIPEGDGQALLPRT